jgi:hypothetical protein
LAGVPFRAIKSRERGVEGWPPDIRVRGPVPPAGLLKASAAYNSPTWGELYAALALKSPAPHSPGFAAVHRPNRHLTLDLTRLRWSHIRYLPICRASRMRPRLAPPRQNPDQRLGGGDCDFKEIQAHPFLASLNWTKVLNREITPEWVSSSGELQTCPTSTKNSPARP